MTDKSSHSSSSTTCGETIKDKRAKRKAKTDSATKMSRLTDPGTS